MFAYKTFVFFAKERKISELQLYIISDFITRNSKFISRSVISEHVRHLHGSSVSLHSSHTAGAAVEFGLRSEAHAHSKRLSHVLDHWRPRIGHHTPHKGHREVKSQHQRLQVLQVTNLCKSHQIHMHIHP